jgi:hypothetical protein
MKTRAHRREQGSTDRAIQDTAEPPLPAVLVLPDNNRDPGLTETLPHEP